MVLVGSGPGDSGPGVVGNKWAWFLSGGKSPVRSCPRTVQNIRRALLPCILTPLKPTIIILQFFFKCSTCCYEWIRSCIYTVPNTADRLEYSFEFLHSCFKRTQGFKGIESLRVSQYVPDTKYGQSQKAAFPEETYKQVPSLKHGSGKHGSSASEMGIKKVIDLIQDPWFYTHTHKKKNHVIAIAPPPPPPEQNNHVNICPCINLLRLSPVL